MVRKVTPFLMFERNAEAAMQLYAATVPNTKIVELERNASDGPGGKAGAVYRGVLSIAGQHVRFFDSPAPHAFKLTPSFSLFVDCESEDEVAKLAGALGDGGQVFMPLDTYPFAKKFAWVGDKFGVSWQLSFA
jgi:predicted 3-demethylubiquinone-9 3-methyltransferase (glyoxalase superfamily)